MQSQPDHHNAHRASANQPEPVDAWLEAGRMDPPDVEFAPTLAAQAELAEVWRYLSAH